MAGPLAGLGSTGYDAGGPGGPGVGYTGSAVDPTVVENLIRTQLTGTLEGAGPTSPALENLRTRDTCAPCRATPGAALALGVLLAVLST